MGTGKRIYMCTGSGVGFCKTHHRTEPVKYIFFPYPQAASEHNPTQLFISVFGFCYVGSKCFFFPTPKATTLYPFIFFSPPKIVCELKIYDAGNIMMIVMKIVIYKLNNK